MEGETVPEIKERGIPEKGRQLWGTAVLEKMSKNIEIGRYSV